MNQDNANTYISEVVSIPTLVIFLFLIIHPSCLCHIEIYKLLVIFIIRSRCKIIDSLFSLFVFSSFSQ